MHELFTGINCFCELVWLGRSVLATIGRIAGAWFQSEAVNTLRARRMALWCFSSLSCLFLLFIRDSDLERSSVRRGVREGGMKTRIVRTYQRLPSTQRSRPVEGVWSSAPPPLNESPSQTNTWPERSKSRFVGVKIHVTSSKNRRRTRSNIRCASLALRIPVRGRVRGGRLRLCPVSHFVTQYHSQSTKQ